MSIATCLDHLGWATRDMPGLHARFERLGFCLTPRSTRAASVQPNGQMTPRPVANRCAMLREGGYLEVIGAADPAQPISEFDRYMDRYDGIHIVALGMGDADANLARLRRGNLSMVDARSIERPVNDEEPSGPRVRIAHLTFPDAPEARLQLIQHLTPDLLWQERFLAHPNQAVALQGAILAVERPANSAARLSLLAGQPVVPDPLGGFALQLASGVVRLLPPEALPLALPGVVAPAVPFLAAAVVRVSDGGRAVRALLGDQGIETPGGLRAEAGGGSVLFTW